MSFSSNEGFIKGLKRLLEKRDEVKLSLFDDTFCVSFPINSETFEDYVYLEDLGWEEVEYRWLYKLHSDEDDEDDYYDAAYKLVEERLYDS